MATKPSTRMLRPLIYATAAAVAGGGALYFSYRPRNIPGSAPAAVPPPVHGEGGTLIPPRFPLVKTRNEQIEDLKKSAITSATLNKEGSFNDLRNRGIVSEKLASDSEQVYDLLVIGGGATGTGIALDAATRGLKVALVERDDFASGTSSKSTKLVHGGVRYLEKAVWELDYNQ